MRSLLAVALAAVALLPAGRSSASTFWSTDSAGLVSGSDLDVVPTRARSCSQSFRREGDFAFVAVFPRKVIGRVDLEVVTDAESPRRAGGYAFWEACDYLAAKCHLDDLPGPGHYELRVKLGSETLASGSFDLTE